MEWSGFALLILVGVGIISTGQPAAFVLIAVASLGAVLGLASGTIPFSLLSALPARLINLFDNDLLQALPLYVTMGLLLGRLPVADALYRTSNAILPKRASAPLVCSASRAWWPRGSPPKACLPPRATPSSRSLARSASWCRPRWS